MTSGNPWQAESLQDFSFLCCPECVFRTQEELEFQSHALITHPESRFFFNKLEGILLVPLMFDGVTVTCCCDSVVL